MTIFLRVNGKSHEIDADPSTPLLYVLRNELALHGPKFGCGLGQCGACTVHVDGRASFSCVLPIAAVGNREITTLEGLLVEGRPNRLQQAFIDEQAASARANASIRLARSTMHLLVGSGAFQGGLYLGRDRAPRRYWPLGRSGRRTKVHSDRKRGLGHAVQGFAPGIDVRPSPCLARLRRAV